MTIPIRFRLTPHTVRRLAVEAVCDDRTIGRYISGAPIRDLSRERVEAAIRKLNAEHDEQAKSDAKAS